MGDPLTSWHGRVEVEPGDPPPPPMTVLKAHRTNCPDCLITVKLHRIEVDPGWATGIYHQDGCPSFQGRLDRFNAAEPEPEPEPDVVPDSGRVTGADVVHIVGPPIQMGNLLRQRCVWCGEALIDVDLNLVNVRLMRDDGVVPEGPHTWPTFTLIACTGAMREVIPADMDAASGGCTVPAECCARRVSG